MRPLPLLAALLPAALAAQQPATVLRLDAPITRWDEAIPVGNGLLGGLLWGGDSTLYLSLDRGDLWDERTPAIFSDPEWTWKGMQALVRAGNMTRFHELFDEPYDKLPYPTKLPAGRVVIEWRSCSGAPMAIDRFELNLGLGEAYAIAGHDTVKVAALADKSGIIMQATTGYLLYGLTPPKGVTALGYDAPVERVNVVPHSDLHTVTYEQPTRGDSSYAVTVYERTRDLTTLGVSTSALRPRGEGSNWAPPVAGMEVAVDSGWTAAVRQHRAWWRDFWSTSSVTLPDTALQTQYDLAKYFYGAAARMGAPPIPLQGVWTADNDALPPWKGDYHNDLNTQMTYLAAHQAGLDEAMDGWLTFLEERLPEFRRFARDFYGVDGAVIPGVMTLSGKPMGGWGMYSLSPTNGAWVAWSFYHQWRMTGDSTFLAERAYPFVREIGTALLALLERGEDGLLRLPLSSSPEIHDNSIKAFLTPNSTYDAVLLRLTFNALADMAIHLGNQAAAEDWGFAASRVAGPEIDDATGAFKVSPDEDFAVSHRHFSHAMAIHPFKLGGTLSPVVGATLDQIASLGTRQWTGYSFAWFAGMLAEAGRGEEAYRYLSDYLAFTSRNGFHLNGDQSGRGLSDFTYRPFTLEGNFLAMDAIQRMLVNTYDDGSIRIFPAIPTSWADVSFDRLRVEGGWMVSASRQAGTVRSVRITAGPGGQLVLRNPFRAGAAVRWSGARLELHDGVWIGEVERGKTVVGALPRP